MKQQDVNLLSKAITYGSLITIALYFYIVRYLDIKIDTFFILLSIFYCTLILAGIAFELVSKIEELNTNIKVNNQLTGNEIKMFHQVEKHNTEFLLGNILEELEKINFYRDFPDGDFYKHKNSTR